MSDDFIKACSSSEIEQNKSKAFTIGDYDVLLCHTAEGFMAVENECTHQLQKLEGGRIKKCFVFCPAHGVRFNLKDGKPIGQLTEDPLKVFDVKIEGDDVLIATQPRPVD